MFTSTLLNNLREYLKESISYAGYTVGGTEHKARIESAAVTADERISVSFIIDPTLTGGEEVTCVNLYDANDTLLVSRDERIARADANEGIMYRFYFTIEEVLS